MRPLRLEVRAFGPFAGGQSIDFRRLGEASLFLIHGPTGAGKSTVLDAVCFALYGESSGGERRAADVRSHFAADDVLTEVVLEFRRGGDEFRIRRTPEQERPKLRGEGTTTEPHGARLERRVDGAWRTLAARPREAAEEVERILGFDVEQFRQVVVLPQGRFRDLLTAGSHERGEILSTLFRTEEYARVAAALHREEQELSARIETLRTVNRTTLEDEGFETVDDLRTAADAAASDVRHHRARLQAIAEEEAAATDERDRARKAEDLFLELEHARAHCDALESRVDEMDRLRRDRRRAELAAGLDDLRVEVGGRRRSVAARGAEVEGLAEDVRKAAEDVRTAAEAYEAERAREPERSAASGELHRLESLRGRMCEVEETRHRLRAARAAARAAEASAAEARDGLDRARSAQRELEDRRRADADVASTTEALRLRVERLIRLSEDAATRDDARPRLERLRTELDAADGDLEATAAASRAASELARELRTLHLEGQAGLLAAALEDGAACPVCGATEHPRPASTPPSTPTVGQVEAAEAEARGRRDQLDEARDRAGDLRREADRSELLLSQSLERLGEDATTPLEQLATALRGARSKLSEAEAAAERSAETARGLAEAAADVARLEGELASADAALQRARRDEATAAALADERARDLPDELSTAEALEAAAAAAAASRQRLENALERARRAAEAARGRHGSLAARLAAAHEELDAAREALRGREDELLERLRADGFDDEEDLGRARRDPEQRAGMAREIDAYDIDRASAADRLRRARDAAGEQERPDIAAVEAALEEVRARARDTRDAVTRLDERSTRLRGRLASIAERAAETERLDARHRLVEDLSRVANDRAMPFARFVLAAMLDDVLARASHRLASMSHGRFRLRRELGRRDGRSAGGLDLVVFDGYTGEERPAGTLSGGEGFLASLALALGLADTVQAEAGGVHLDTIFIDEGFGSLDPEALELAYGTLLSLPAEGRLVGVISHVPELRDLIPARVEISATTSGSTVRVVT